MVSAMYLGAIRAGSLAGLPALVVELDDSGVITDDVRTKLLSLVAKHSITMKRVFVLAEHDCPALPLLLSEINETSRVPLIVSAKLESVPLWIHLTAHLIVRVPQERWHGIPANEHHITLTKADLEELPRIVPASTCAYYFRPHVAEHLKDCYSWITQSGYDNWRILSPQKASFRSDVW